MISRILDIDFLKSLAVKNDSEPYWFGLGFIQLKLSDSQRIHFWCSDIPRPEREEIHDHRYNFTSMVLGGTLVFDLFHPTPMQRDHVFTHELFQTNCAPGNEGNADPKVFPVTLTKTGSYRLPAGSTYWFSEEQFHTTEPTKFAITYLRRESKHKAFANVIKVKGAPISCPFKETMPVAKCWEHIAHALSEAKCLNGPIMPIACHFCGFPSGSFGLPDGKTIYICRECAVD